MIAIVDYDIGNVGAVANMLRRLGAPCQITANPGELERANSIILPGNGAFDACMRNLRASGLVAILERRVLVDRVPLLGICVGAQMLGWGSEEGTEAGLQWIDMRVRRFPRDSHLRVPHMGWNDVKTRGIRHSLVCDLEAHSRFYFVHSYYMEPADPKVILLSATYGVEFAAAVAQGNISGVQFHPEKSHRFGMRLLGNFARISLCTGHA